MILSLSLLLAVPQDEAGAAFHRADNVAGCMLRKNRIDAARFAATEPGSPEEAAQINALPKTLARCVTDWADLRQVPDAIAQRLFNQFIIRSSLEPLAPDRENEIADNLLGHDRSDTPAKAAIRCLAVLKPQAAGNLVRSKMGSAEETQSLQSVLTAIPRCVPHGEQVRWQKLRLRLDLARELYRGVAQLVIERGL